MSRIPTNADAALVQAKMNIRILALKHAMKLEAHRVALRIGVPEAVAPSPVNVVASAGIIEEYLLEGIFTPATPATAGSKSN